MLQEIVGKPRGQQLKVIYPKQEDSWEYGYYVMSWIRTIIRAAIKDEWIECFEIRPTCSLFPFGQQCAETLDSLSKAQQMELSLMRKPSLQGNPEPKSVRLSSQENLSKKERSHAKH
ncbi:hypothetical protein DEO72_LG8g2592 [Vigna unguiculata]|uniref:Uncharacterized protein n=1 Tax=Vigna unguiculata TaxID=3917 RepID=A0A4D6MSW2_VIGUN|nr:hypothetical protein DEO72_LG8g2592 [Vigna unguiculata]